MIARKALGAGKAAREECERTLCDIPRDLSIFDPNNRFRIISSLFSSHSIARERFRDLFCPAISLET